MSRARHAAWLWITLPVIATDQATKFVLERWTPEDYTRTIVPGFFDLVHRHNPGVAFSLLADMDSAALRAGLVVFSLSVMGLLAWLLTTGQAGSGRTRWGLALILGGAAGNLIDRLLHGSVVDFLDFYAGRHHWPAFNVADSCIVIGAGLVVLDLLFDRQRSRDAATG